jgi:hypothetical protein
LCYTFVYAFMLCNYVKKIMFRDWLSRLGTISSVAPYVVTVSRVVGTRWGLVVSSHDFQFLLGIQVDRGSWPQCMKIHIFGLHYWVDGKIFLYLYKIQIVMFWLLAQFVFSSGINVIPFMYLESIIHVF